MVIHVLHMSTVLNVILWIVQFGDFGCHFWDFVANVFSQLGQLAQDEHKEMHLVLLQQEFVANLKWTKHGTDLAV